MTQTPPANPQPSQDGAAAPPEQDGESVLAGSVNSFRSGQRGLLRYAMAGLLIVLAVEWCWIVTRKPDPILLQRGESFRRQFRVDVNAATWIEWSQLEGIGPALAHRIVAERNAHGPFRSIDDVDRVPGIGPAKLDQMRPWLTIGHDITTTSVSNGH